MRLVRWEPFTELASLQNEFNKVFNENFVGSDNKVNTWSPRIELSESKEHYKVKADLPGLNKEDIDISFNEKTLTITGERKEVTEEEGTNFYKKEINYGSFKKQIFLSEDINSENITASYNNGVLELVIPKSEKTQPRKIVVQ